MTDSNTLVVVGLPKESAVRPVIIQKEESPKFKEKKEQKTAAQKKSEKKADRDSTERNSPNYTPFQRSNKLPSSMMQHNYPSESIQLCSNL